MSYTDPFGGSTIQPAQVSYNSLSITANTTLVWPDEATDDNFLSRILDVLALAGLSLIFPDARRVSVGWDVLISNIGANAVTVLKADGVTTLCSIPAGQVFYLYLTDNSTANGTWRSTQFASTASAATAASLVGPGIGATGPSLYNASQTTVFSSSYPVVMADRTKAFAWTGGVGTLSLLSVLSAGSDFFISITNQGTGVLTIDPSGAELVDGNPTLALSVGESCVLHCNGATGWYTVGRGRSALFNFTLLSKGITTGTVTLSLSEAANVVQKYTGVLVGNVEVVLPRTVQVYYVSNQTSGAFTVNFKTAGVGSTVTVPTGQNAVLFCDGTNVINASTTVSGIASLTMNQGTVAQPSLNYSGDITTGMYSPAAGSIAWSLLGVQKLLLNNAGLTSANPVFLPLGAVGAPSLSLTGDTTTGMYSPGAGVLSWALAGAQKMTLNSVGLGVGAVPTNYALEVVGPGSFGGALSSVNIVLASLTFNSVGLVQLNSTTFAASAASKYSAGILSVPKTSADTAGTTNLYGGFFQPIIESTTVGSASNITGVYAQAVRDKAADLGSNAFTTGVYGAAGHRGTVPAACVSSVVNGVFGSGFVDRGSVTTLAGVNSSVVVNSISYASNVSVGSAAAFDTSSVIIGNATTLTTITSLYGLRLQAPTVNAGVTITNRYGVSSEDASATNYFAGTMGIGVAASANVRLNVDGPIRAKGYTVATLPAAGTAGRRAYVTDATAPTFLGALVGGGGVTCPVFDNGAAWVAG